MPQSISPGWVRTEFAARLQKDDDVEAVKKSMGDVSATWKCLGTKKELGFVITFSSCVIQPTLLAHYIY